MTLSVKSLRLRGLETAWWQSEAASKSAPVLFFLHGFPDTPQTWDRQTEYFSGRFLVIAPYARGAGRSEPGRSLSRYREEATTLDLLQILKHVDPKGKRPVFLVGHDLGAVAAWNLAPLLGERLKGLVIINGLSLSQMFARRKKLKQHLKSWYIYAFQIPKVPEFLAARFQEPCLRLAHTLGRLPEAHRPSLDEPLAGSLPHYRAFAREFPWLGRRSAVKLSAKVLVLWGSEDAFLLPPTLDELTPYAASPESRVLPGNHWIHRERAREVNETLDRFFAAQVPGMAP
jgi:epoxide hydrolase 4